MIILINKKAKLWDFLVGKRRTQTEALVMHTVD
jgi:hypothetical protein